MAPRPYSSEFRLQFWTGLKTGEGSLQHLQSAVFLSCLCWEDGGSSLCDGFAGSCGCQRWHPCPSRTGCLNSCITHPNKLSMSTVTLAIVSLEPITMNSVFEPFNFIIFASIQLLILVVAHNPDAEELISLRSPPQFFHLGRNVSRRRALSQIPKSVPRRLRRMSCSSVSNAALKSKTVSTTA